jgi:hypothetical protein
MWYTLTGNFGDLLPINYWSKPSLIRKYHSESLNLKSVMSGNDKRRVAAVAANVERLNRRELDLNLDSYENLLNGSGAARGEEETTDAGDYEDSNSDGCCGGGHGNGEDENEDEDEDEEEEVESAKRMEKRRMKRNRKRRDERRRRRKSNVIDINEEDVEDYMENDEEDDEEDDEDLHELREQLDMHSMILSKSLYEGAEFNEPIVTAEEVLNEIESIINMVCTCYSLFFV